MSIHSTPANPETLIFLAWATRAGLQKDMIEVQKERRNHGSAKPERVLRARITYSQPPVFEVDSVYGPVYQALFNYRLDRVEFDLIDWVLRGSYGVYLRDADVEECASTTPETGLLWKSITQNENLLFRIKRIGREWNGEVRKAANALRLHFTYQTPLLMRTPESSFLFQEFIKMSLEQVNWMELATHVLEVPYQPEPAFQIEEKMDDEEAMQIALMREMLWRGYVDFGEFSQCPLFAESTRELCLELADHCRNMHQEICKLEKKSTDSSSASP